MELKSRPINTKFLVVKKRARKAFLTLGRLSKSSWKAQRKLNTYYRANCSESNSLLALHPTDLYDWLLKTALDGESNFKDSSVRKLTVTTLV